MQAENTAGFPVDSASATPEIGHGSEEGTDAKSATTPTPPSNVFNANANINVTINDLSGSSLINLQNLFTSPGGKNLVIYLGHPQVFLTLLQSLIIELISMMPEWKIVDSSIASAIGSLPLDSNLGMPFYLHGFPPKYFCIRAAGTRYYWALHGGDSSKDGNVICLRESSQSEARPFFLSSRGELCTDSAHIDVLDNTLIAAHERPPTFPSPNPWSHKPATFSYSNETRMITIKLHADPLISSEWPRPEKEWKDKEFIIAARPPTLTRIRRSEEISRWAPNLSLIRWTNRTNRLEANAWNAVGVEEKGAMMELEDINRIKWVIEQF